MGRTAKKQERTPLPENQNPEPKQPTIPENYVRLHGHLPFQVAYRWRLRFIRRQRQVCLEHHGDTGSTRDGGETQRAWIPMPED